MSGESSKGSSNNSSFSSPIGICKKLPLQEHLVAYLDKQELKKSSEQVNCDNSLVERVMSNYVIVKQIISHLSWQDKLLCKDVCSMWNSVVHTLEKEHQNPEDFIMVVSSSVKRNTVKLKKSGEIRTKPIAVFTFVNSLGDGISAKCGSIEPRQCIKPCEYEHCLLDVIHQNIVAPKDCMLTVRSNYLAYMSIPSTPTYEHNLTQFMYRKSMPIICGLFIPAIHNVEFEVINIKSISDMKTDFYDVIDRISKTHIIKGVLAYIKENYLLNTVEDIVFMNYFKEVQPSIPYACGGCIVEDTMSYENNISTLISNYNAGDDIFNQNLATISLFTIPKNVDGCNFDMYSLILESSDWTKEKIEKKINEFAKRVPQFEHSVSLKLSCVGRDQKHGVEQHYFRVAFPRTRLVGCYGNGELGLNHPFNQTNQRAVPSEYNKTMKRIKRNNTSKPQFEIMYSYSTVFVYIGWGKVVSPPDFT